MPSIRVVSNGSDITVENDTVDNVRALFREVAATLNIDPTASVAVNGVPADLDTPLADGDEVTTTKPAGTKGQ